MPREPRRALAAPLRTSATAQQSCIFKVYDDCRQDALAIQVIQLLKACFDPLGLGLHLSPYKVVPSRVGKEKAAGGILECVPDVKSIDEIGKSGFPSLYHYFRSRFGRVDGAPFERARRNFIRSLAPYAVVSYILRVKDRHNGNILVDKDGHLVHIDFGFLLGISPGGNLGFETAAFKLTREMVNIMGGDENAEQFLYFSELTSRAYLQAREHSEATEATVSAFADSGLPCYHFPTTLSNVSSLHGVHHFDNSDT